METRPQRPWPSAIALILDVKKVASYGFGQRNRWLAHLVHCVEVRLERLLSARNRQLSTAFQSSPCGPFFGKQHREFKPWVGAYCFGCLEFRFRCSFCSTCSTSSDNWKAADPIQGPLQTIDGTAIATPLLSVRLISIRRTICRRT